jgi:RNA polymerase sigma-70 factor (ECF subfamily)
LALDHVKRAESRLALSVEDVGGSDNLSVDPRRDQTFDQVASNEEFSQFCEAVRKLPVQCRRAFVLKKVYGFSQREIATEMNLSESTVEKHIAEGIKRCTYYFMKHADIGAVKKMNRQPGQSEHLLVPRAGGKS